MYTRMMFKKENMTVVFKLTTVVFKLIYLNFPEGKYCIYIERFPFGINLESGVRYNNDSDLILKLHP